MQDSDQTQRLHFLVHRHITPHQCTWNALRVWPTMSTNEQICATPTGVDFAARHRNPSTAPLKLSSKSLHPCLPILLSNTSALSTSLKTVRSMPPWLSCSGQPDLSSSKPAVLVPSLETLPSILSGNHLFRIEVIELKVHGILTAKMRSCRTSGKSRAARCRDAESLTLTKWPQVGAGAGLPERTEERRLTDVGT